MQKIKPIYAGLALLPILAVAVRGYGDSKLEQSSAFHTTSSNHLRIHVVCSAGSHGTSDHFRAISTMGQPTPIGAGASGEIVLSGGFWRAFEGIQSPVEPVVPQVPENALYQNYPNPFNPITTIRYSVASQVPVSLVVYNVQGRRVHTLVNETKREGIYSVIWDGSNEKGQQVASGVYFYQLKIGSERFVKKMLLLK